VHGIDDQFHAMGAKEKNTIDHAMSDACKNALLWRAHEHPEHGREKAKEKEERMPR
jgi:hypothetical protein